MAAAQRRPVVVGGNRTPFARAGGAYARSSNRDLLTAALDGLVARFGLAGERLGEVAAGAVLKHSRDFNLTRESVLGSALANDTPAYDVQMACATGMETVMSLSDKIRLGRVDVAVAGGVDSASDAPIVVSEPMRAALLELNRARTTSAKLKALAKIRPSHRQAGRAGRRRAAHRAVDGRAPGPDHRRVGHHARGPGRARPGQPPAPRRRVRGRVLRRPHHAVPRPDARRQPARRTPRWRSSPRSSRCSASAWTPPRR